MGDVVPIMLVGLGIDYAIHLVMRYREERVHYGKTIKDALVLTTASVVLPSSWQPSPPVSPLARTPYPRSSP